MKLIISLIKGKKDIFKAIDQKSGAVSFGVDNVPYLPQIGYNGKKAYGEGLEFIGSAKQ